ncbi:MAG: hypothetical protein CMM83_05150 [Rhodospirillales bacterium]|nr:hypothetical protein [Rhodospirillales bacterium]|tara:strand:+ start:2263 stop:3564 length:1302 start_codon:yes stop_codon:yes gene_type:complete
MKNISLILAVRRNKTAIIYFFWLFLATVCPNADTHAQSVERIAAIVNDDIVSAFDLRARLKVVIATSGIRPSRRIQEKLKQQVLRTLIDEKLQLQEAKRRNISISKKNIWTATRLLEKQNKIKPGKFTAFLKERDLPRSAIFNRMRSQIAWTKLIKRRLVPKITIGDDEIEEILRRLKEQKGQSEFRISEIFISLNNDKRELDTKRFSQRLIDEIKAGANFQAIARQFSAAASASTGGDLGWLHENVLEKDLALTVKNMKKGEIYGPIRTQNGFQIYRLVNKRKILEAPPGDAIVDLHRITLSISKKNYENDYLKQMKKAKHISENTFGCEEMEKIARVSNPKANFVFEKLVLKNLNNPLRSIIQDLKIQRASKPLITTEGISVYMVCQKTLPLTYLPSKKIIRKRLMRQKLSVLVRRYMRDLRSAAVINIRI